ncbi:exosortase X [Hymenobacter monticola]|uniref:Exosortase/archaeosortase family protein n=1 Tax=Hymenobacter monticola TaxID=1705399 RepID=A0ABY4BA00_9BACT|nr:archaeosortase/exosortase family protein [Hymenobacter monticola]UOE35724.1 exosortase/archaeosortase family protein [Hymenobacter monticola]
MQSTAPATAPPDNRLLFRFLLVAGALYLAWFFVYQRWLEPDGRLDAALCGQIASSSASLLRIIGFGAAVAPADAQLLLMNGEPSVIVYPPCNGLVLYTLFAGFVLAFPGPGRRKAWFIPAGIALLWLLNVLRVAALALNHHYARQTVDFNHHYTFAIVVYGCIFGLWMLWARRLAPAPHAPAN